MLAEIERVKSYEMFSGLDLMLRSHSEIAHARCFLDVPISVTFNLHDNLINGIKSDFFLEVRNDSTGQFLRAYTYFEGGKRVLLTENYVQSIDNKPTSTLLMPSEFRKMLLAGNLLEDIGRPIDALKLQIVEKLKVSPDEFVAGTKYREFEEIFLKLPDSNIPDGLSARDRGKFRSELERKNLLYSLRQILDYSDIGYFIDEEDFVYLDSIYDPLFGESKRVTVYMVKR